MRDDRGKRRTNTLHLRRRDHFRHHLGKARLLYATHDVLPAISLEQHVTNLGGLRRQQRSATARNKVLGIGLGLYSYDGIDRTDELDEVGDALLTLRGGQPRMLRPPFELVQYRVLRFFLPVEQENRNTSFHNSESSSSGAMLER